MYVCIFALALSLSPAGRVRAWDVDLLWGHWLGVAVWFGMFTLAHLRLEARLPGRDPRLLPAVALLTGWGMLTVWRLLPQFGTRQAAWLALSVGVLIAGLRLDGNLGFLRRYKYLWLTGALTLTGATFLFGVNPLGVGPRMWLGCCGVYLQPSEPMKLLLIAYLAAYMADLQPALALADGTAVHGRLRSWAALTPLLAPTLVMTGLALVVLIVQRDLGAAVIYLLIYAAVVYLASGSRLVPAAALLSLAASGLLGYRLFDVVRIRMDAWINPWLDPSGRSYQIVQSLIAIANGGLIGRGPGIGNPALVPLSHSDLIFSAIAEETGLIGVIGLLCVLGLVTGSGLRAAMRARSSYHRYLAAGLTALLVGQSLLIIAGSLRLMPLTGVTLPFVSYGGSSLLTAFICLLLLLHISHHPDSPPAPLRRPAVYPEMAAVVLVGLLACALAAGWWALARSERLLTRTDNQRRYIADRYVHRGSILDRSNKVIVESTGIPGEIERRILYPDLSSLTGYTNPTYGQAGLESSLDGYLSGRLGYPELEMWWDHLLYGQHPPGLDVRLSLDLDLQRNVDNALGNRLAGLAVVHAGSGEILALASHPTFDANRLDEQHADLITDSRAPLFNRAVQGRYPFGTLAKTLFPEGVSAFGLNRDALQVGVQLVDAEGLAEGLTRLLPVPISAGDDLLRWSPLQAALGAATLSAGGVRPGLQLATAVNLPTAGWTPFEPPESRQTSITYIQALERLTPLALADRPIWIATAAVVAESEGAWAVGGTLPGWEGTPFGLAVYVEGASEAEVREIANLLLEAVLGR